MEKIQQKAQDREDQVKKAKERKANSQSEANLDEGSSEYETGGEKGSAPAVNGKKGAAQAQPKSPTAGKPSNSSKGNLPAAKGSAAGSKSNLPVPKTAKK